MNANSQKPQNAPWWTWANALSSLRFLLAPVVCFALFGDLWTVALMAFVVACLSDAVDGPVARWLGSASALGGKVDHCADAVFVFCGLLALGLTERVFIGLCAAQAFAFLLYLLDSRRLSQPLIASRLGKFNGVAYFFIVGIPVVQLGLGLHWIPDAWILVASYLLAISTGISILSRYDTRRKRLRRQLHER